MIKGYFKKDVFINFAKFFNYELIKMGLLQDKLAKYDEPQKYMAEGIYLISAK